MSAWPVTKAPEPRYCSFCGRSEHEADVLIAGPNSVFICDGCVDHCVELIAAKKRVCDAVPKEQGGSSAA